MMLSVKGILRIFL